MRVWMMVAMLGCSGSGEERRPEGPAETTSPDQPARSPFPESPAGTNGARVLGPVSENPMRIPIDGGEVRVELRAPARFMVGEPAFAQLVLTAQSDGRPSYRAASFYSRPPDSRGRPPGFFVSFRGADGRVLGDPPGTPGNGGSGQTNGPIELPLWAYAQLTPGRWTLHVETTVQVGDTERSVALETQVEVTPFDPAAVAGVIDALGASAVSDEYERWDPAVRLLQQVRDPRVVPWWIRLGQARDAQRRSLAISALRTWNDPRAREALVRASRTQPGDLDPQEFTTEALRVETAANLRRAATEALEEMRR